ncbi:MAG: SBBP repeat-containing protein, partial [Promethearchaeota archaeon]
SSSVFSYLKEKDVPLDVLNGHSGRKDVDLPFTGFIQNLGQVNDGSIEYYYSTNGLSIGFSRSHITFVGQSPEDPEPISFALSFSGSQNVVPVGVGKMNHPINYFYGNMQLTNVPSWKEVWYYDLYSGIDLRYYMSPLGLKYDFVVHPGADPSQITVQVSESMTLAIESQSISLQCRHPSHQINLQDTALRAYQADNPVAAQFILKDARLNTYGFQIDSFDPTQVLIIDPLLLVFSTYLGGSEHDTGLGLVMDAAGNSYITGGTTSPDFPITPGAFNETYNSGGDVFVVKLNATGNGLVFSTYVGGSGGDSGQAVALDAVGNSYVTGYTDSNNFPTKNAYQSNLGEWDAFVFKLNATGNGLVFSTYLGGNEGDTAEDIGVDANGNSYVTGSTESTDFPTQNAYDTTYNGERDVFVAKLNATGNGLVFSTYVGGSSYEGGESIAVDVVGNSYIAGMTYSSDFPTRNAYQSNYKGSYELFITKLNPTGDDLVFSTYLGGTDGEGLEGVHIAVDSDGNSYIAGQTGSSDFPTQNAYQSTHKGNYDAFVTKLNGTGNGLIFSTFIGGTGIDIANGITLDAEGNSYITGSTTSSDFPIYDTYNSTYGGNGDVFITKLNITGTGLVFSTYLGGSGIDGGWCVALDTYNNTYVTGSTNSTDFPTKNAYKSTHSGGYYDVFVTKFAFSPVIILNSPANNSVQQSGTVIDLAIIDDNTVNVIYNWDEMAYSTLSLPYDVTLPTGEEQHVLRVLVKDSQNYWSNVTFVFITDDTAPLITLDGPANNSVNSPNTLVNLTITDSGGIGQVLYNWDDSTNKTLEPPYRVGLPPVLPGSTQMTYVFVLRVYAQDAAGNWAAQTYAFTVHASIITTFFPVEVVLLALGALIVVLWRKRKQK